MVKLSTYFKNCLRRYARWIKFTTPDAIYCTIDRATLVQLCNNNNDATAESLIQRLIANGSLSRACAPLYLARTTLHWHEPDVPLCTIPFNSSQRSLLDLLPADDAEDQVYVITFRRQQQ
jgi:hypothetical protein